MTRRTQAAAGSALQIADVFIPKTFIQFSLDKRCDLVLELGRKTQKGTISRARSQVVGGLGRANHCFATWRVASWFPGSFQK